MAITKPQADQLKKAFKRSWMGSDDCVSALSTRVDEHLRKLGGGPGAAFTIADLVSAIRVHVDRVEKGSSHVDTLASSTASVQLGEMLAAWEGGKTFRAAADPELAGNLDALQTLRNVICHPAAVTGDPTFLDSFRERLRADQRDRLDNAISLQPREVQGIEVSLWAITKLNAAGMRELAREVLRRCSQRKLQISRQGTFKLHSVVRPADMARYLERAETAQSEATLLE
jgi:hypothetical protein